jgi:hypothetical protein
MTRPLAIAILALSLVACRTYDLKSPVASQKGLMPADQFARYGREQAISIAIGREFARPYDSGPEKQAENVIKYAKTKFPVDIVDIVPDPLGNRLTVQFKSGWRTAVVPIADGKTGDDTKIPS